MRAALQSLTRDKERETALMILLKLLIVVCCPFMFPLLPAIAGLQWCVLSVLDRLSSLHSVPRVVAPYDRVFSGIGHWAS